MIAMEADDGDRGTVLHYAPRHVRYPSEEHSIRPILERLSRGESGSPADVPVDSAVRAPVPLDPPRRTPRWQLIACSALSAVLSAGVAVLAIGWVAPIKSAPARIDSGQLDPKVVQTVSFQQVPPDRPVPERQNTKPQPSSAPESKPEPPRDQMAPNELLAMWSSIPPEAQADMTTGSTIASSMADVQTPKDPKSETTPAAREEHREPVPHEHRRHHNQRRAHASHKSNAPNGRTGAAQTTESNPLQSALQSVFGGQAAARPEQLRPQQNGAMSTPAQQQSY